MHGWKHKFKFGRNKDDKKMIMSSSHSSLTSNETNVADSIFSRPSTERRDTVTAANGSASVAPVRVSQDSSFSSTFGRESSSDTTGKFDVTSWIKTHKDTLIPPFLGVGSEITKNNSPTDSDMSFGRDCSNGSELTETTRSRLFSRPATIEETETSSGVLTVKVYSGSEFTMPVPITADQNILNKLLYTSLPPQTDSHVNVREEMEQLITQLSQVHLANQLNSDERLISNALSSTFIPSVIRVPGHEDYPLIYMTVEFDNTIATILPDTGTISKPIFNKISSFDVTRKLPYLKFDIFLRIPPVLLPSATWQQEVILRDPSMKPLLDKILSGSDIYLDSFKLPVHLDINSAANFRLYNHQWINLENGLGRVNLTVDFKPTYSKPVNIDDFELLKVLGKGSYGKVMQVKKKDTQKIYALKAIRKSYIISKSEVIHTLAERTILARVDCPFIVPMKFTFQSSEKLYLVLTCINGGELFHHLQNEGLFGLSRARFYIAELLIALETLHNMDVIYRDLKPENILLDSQGHIALCDFGLCKLNMKDDEKTQTFCGTPEYLAPEVLLGQGYTKAIDWWTLGVLLYEMLTGLPPYYDENVKTMYKKILQSPLVFPDGFDPEAKDLLKRLLNRDPKRRLGANGAHDIKKHSFFNDLCWESVWNKEYIPPFRPTVNGSHDTSNFDNEFTEEKPIDSVIEEYLSESMQNQFKGWTYVGTEQLGSSMV
ncbi:Serine/threonine-protein kinase YPK2/YKR2 [Nakaseomyces bracarensis]|uniref:Serine/threonine-protein kinase YPK2/YKR2 n=1 Tax=Nakaseomyces bracarensis TaxID=273131 RepID=A0ABR4NMJ3_9SACH